MGIDVIEGEHYAVLYCNTTMWAFGPTFSSAEDAWAFRQWVDRGPREYSDSELESLYAEWNRTRGIDFDSTDEQEAFAEWLSRDIIDYELNALEKIHAEWKRTVWSGEE